MDIDFDHNMRHKSSLSKYVKVKTVDSREHEGWLKCIDPISGNLFLVTYDDSLTDVLDTILIMGDGYKSLEVIKEADENMKKLIDGWYRSDKTFSPEVAADRKKRLVAWIKKHRLPVTEKDDGTLVVCEVASISAPYGIDECSSLNNRVLNNMRELVAKLPGDV